MAPQQPASRASEPISQTKSSGQGVLKALTPFLGFLTPKAKGVGVASAPTAAEEETKAPTDYEKAMALFDKHDADGSGQIDMGECVDVMEEFMGGLAPTFVSQFNRKDTNQDGVLSRDEFYQVMVLR